MMNKKILFAVILIIIIAAAIATRFFWPKPEEIVIEESKKEPAPRITEKPSCFDSSKDPIPICNCEDLQRMKENLTANYILENDINCSDTKNWNGGKGFEPIGKEKEPFSGTFDGKNYIIANLYISRADEDYVGLFGYTECLFGSEFSFPCLSRGRLTNVNLKNINIEGNNGVGGLIGNSHNGLVTNSFVEGFLTGNDDIGGLVGKNMENGVITDSFTDVNLFNGNKDVGGLVGENEGIIISSFSKGSVSGIKGVGGLIGENESIATHSYSASDVTGDENVGGFVGDLDPGTVTNSYALGFVSGNKDVGGFAGDIHGGIIKNSFSAGKVNALDRVGGFNGVNHGGKIINSYWAKTSKTSLSCIGQNRENGRANCRTIEGNESYFYNINNQPINLWKFPPWSRENNNKDYPVLEKEQYYTEEMDLTEIIDELLGPEEPIPLPGGNSEEEEKPPIEEKPPVNEEEPPVQGISCFDSSKDPIPICNCEDLQRMKENLTANYILENDINCSDTKNWNNGKGFEPIAPDINFRIAKFQGEKFAGTFNGQNYIIYNLYINRPNEDYVALFGYSEGKIEKTNLRNIDITGHIEVGGVVGENHGIITTSSVTGAVFGQEDVGGLTGENEPGGFITDSYSLASSNAVEDVGVLVGENEDTIIDSYAAGKVVGADNVGGFVGDNEGTITNSYSTSSVSSGKDVGGLVGVNQGLIKNSYWNKPAGSSLACVGKLKAGAADCNIIESNKNYFYNLNNEPMSLWKFPPWSRENNNKDYPVLQGQ